MTSLFCQTELSLSFPSRTLQVLVGPFFSAQVASGIGYFYNIKILIADKLSDTHGFPRFVSDPYHRFFQSRVSMGGWARRALRFFSDHLYRAMLLFFLVLTRPLAVHISDLGSVPV